MVATGPRLSPVPDVCPFCHVNRKWPGTHVCNCFVWTGEVTATAGTWTINETSGTSVPWSPPRKKRTWKADTLSWLRDREMAHQTRRPQDCGRHRFGKRHG